jgi:hypothetical protein
MKTTIKKSAIRSTDELWQWAALKRSASLQTAFSPKRSVSRSSVTMAHGILNRLCEILRVTAKTAKARR